MLEHNVDMHKYLNWFSNLKTNFIDVFQEMGEKIFLTLKDGKNLRKFPAIQPKATCSSANFKAKDTLAPVSSESESNESELSNPLPRSHRQHIEKIQTFWIFFTLLLKIKGRDLQKNTKRKNKSIMNAWTSCDNFWRKCQMALIKILQSKPQAQGVLLDFDWTIGIVVVFVIFRHLKGESDRLLSVCFSVNFSYNFF